jgi:rubrerythrin
MISPAAIEQLEQCRTAEKEQALFYRSLAVVAEERNDAALSERLQLLHADEQHHLSRLTARLMELGRPTPDPGPRQLPTPALDGWEGEARRREQAEVARYEALLQQQLDAKTVTLVEGILEVERAHARELGGKWTMA